jgi:hypothetical protein
VCTENSSTSIECSSSRFSRARSDFTSPSPGICRVRAASSAVEPFRIRAAASSATTAERWTPEATYFGTFEGKRTAFVVFDMPDSSDMVAFGEPFFMAVDADVEVVPIMNADDLQKGLGKLG